MMNERALEKSAAHQSPEKEDPSQQRIVDLPYLFLRSCNKTKTGTLFALVSATCKTRAVRRPLNQHIPGP
jgi:hypothetical protein